MISKAAVLELLKGLLEQAGAVKAEVGNAPTAQEALTWAIASVTEMPPAP